MTVPRKDGIIFVIRPQQSVPNDSCMLRCDAVPLGSLALKSETLRSFETSGTTHDTTELNIPEDLNVQDETVIDHVVQYTKQQKYIADTSGTGIPRTYDRLGSRPLL